MRHEPLLLGDHSETLDVRLHSPTQIRQKNNKPPSLKENYLWPPPFWNTFVSVCERWRQEGRKHRVMWIHRGYAKTGRVKSLRKKRVNWQHCAEMPICFYCYHNFTTGSLSLAFVLLFLIPWPSKPAAARWWLASYLSFTVPTQTIWTVTWIGQMKEETAPLIDLLSQF